MPLAPDFGDSLTLPDEPSYYTWIVFLTARGMTLWPELWDRPAAGSLDRDIPSVLTPFCRRLDLGQSPVWQYLAFTSDLSLLAQLSHFSVGRRWSPTLGKPSWQCCRYLLLVTGCICLLCSLPGSAQRLQFCHLNFIPASVLQQDIAFLPQSLWSWKKDSTLSSNICIRQSTKSLKAGNLTTEEDAERKQVLVTVSVTSWLYFGKYSFTLIVVFCF